MQFIRLYAAAAVAFLITEVPVTEAWSFRTKRDVWVPADPLAYEVKITFDSFGRFLAPIGMGKPFAQAGNFSFLLSTSSPWTGVAAANCTSCASQIGSAPVYNISKSTSATLQGTTRSFNMGSGSMSGALISESCTFKKVKSSGWSFANQTVVMVQNTTGILGSGASGFVGFGRSTGNDSYVSGLVNNQESNNMTFGFALNKFDSSANATTSQSAGSLSVRETNPDSFAGEIHWQPLAPITNVPTNMPSDWAIKFDSYKISFGNQSTTNSGGVAIIEPYFQELRIPSDEAVEIFNVIPNAKMTNDSTSLSWVVPCDQDLTVSINIGGNTYRMRKDLLISYDSTGTVCTSLVKGWADPVVRASLFGTPFATTAYIVYNAHKNQSADEIGVAPRSADPNITIINQGVSTTVLVGVVVGSIVGMTLIVSVLFFFLYRRRRQGPDAPKPDNEKPGVTNKFTIEPFTSGAPPNSATPMLSTTAGRTGYVIEQGPIGGEPGEGDVLSQEPGASPNSARSLDRKRSLPPNLTLVRQSQMTDSSGLTPSPEPSPDQELHTIVQSLPPLSHSFYGTRVPTIRIAPESEAQRRLSPEIPDSPVSAPPPPYIPRATGTIAPLPSSLPSVREKH